MCPISEMGLLKLGVPGMEGLAKTQDQCNAPPRNFGKAGLCACAKGSEDGGAGYDSSGGEGRFFFLSGRRLVGVSYTGMCQNGDLDPRTRVFFFGIFSNQGEQGTKSKAQTHISAGYKHHLSVANERISFCWGEGEIMGPVATRCRGGLNWEIRHKECVEPAVSQWIPFAGKCYFNFGLEI